MSTYQNNFDNGQNMDFTSGFYGNDTQNQSGSKQKQPLISFRYHPGFLCFFEDYVNKKDWTFYECYQKVFQSHHQMMKVRQSTKSIMQNQELDKVQKINKLMQRSQKDKKYAYYLEKQNGELQCNLISHQDRRIEQLSKLQDQLSKLQQLKSRVINKKKKQFQLKQMERSRSQQRQVRNLMTQKQRRADKVRTTQRQAEQLKKKLELQREIKREQALKQGNNCSIM